MRRRRSTKVKLNTKLMMDVVGAGLIVKNLPKVINMVIPLDPMISTVAAVGGGYMTGVMLKRPDLANASIAVGIAQFVDPMIDNLIGGAMPLIPGGANLLPGGGVPAPEQEPAPNVADFLRLNDYLKTPGRAASVDVYRDSY